jgi:hypothetical protein
MGPVEVDISVDGFITSPGEERAGLGQGGEILHDPGFGRLVEEFTWVALAVPVYIDIDLDEWDV